MNIVFSEMPDSHWIIDSTRKKYNMVANWCDNVLAYFVGMKQAFTEKLVHRTEREQYLLGLQNRIL